MHKKDDIVLVNPPFSLKDNFGLLDFAGQYGPPLNVLYLASSLEKEGLNTRVVDLSYEPKTLEAKSERNHYSWRCPFHIFAGRDHECVSRS